MILYFLLLTRDGCRWWWWWQSSILIIDLKRFYSNNYWTWFLAIHAQHKSLDLFSPFDRIMPFIKLISNIECNVFSGGRISREYQFTTTPSTSAFLAYHALLWCVLYCMCFLQKSEFSFAFHYFEFFDGCVCSVVYEERENGRTERNREGSDVSNHLNCSALPCSVKFSSVWR